MKSRVFPMLLFIMMGLVFLALPPVAYGQTRLESISWLAKRIERDVSATFHVCDFPRVLEYLRSHPIFKQREFRQGFDAVMESDQAFLQQWELFSEFIESIEQVHAVVWRRDLSASSSAGHSSSMQSTFPVFDTEFALVIKVDRKGYDNIDLGFLRFLVTGVKNKDADGKNQFNLPDAIASEFHEPWLVLGSSEKRVADICSSINGRLPEPSLLKDRRFKNAIGEFKSRPKSAIQAFVRPKYFPAWYSSSRGRKRVFENEKINELSFGTEIVEFSKSDADLICHSSVHNTSPVVGVANTWRASEPIKEDLPGFCFEIEGIEVKSTDPKELLRVSRENYDSIHGDGEYLKYVAKETKGSDIQIHDFFNRSVIKIYVHYKNDLGFRRLMTMEKVEDYGAMKKYVEYLVGKSSGGKSLKPLDEFPATDGDAIAYGLSKKEVRREWDKKLERLRADVTLWEWYERNYRHVLEESGKSLEEIGDLFVENRAKILTRDWFVSGELCDAFQLIDYLNGDEEANDEFERIISRTKVVSKASKFGLPVYIRTGRFYQSRVVDAFYEFEKSKYKKSRTEIHEELFSGFRSDKLDFAAEAGYDSIDMIVSLLNLSFSKQCRDMVFLRFKKQGEKVNRSFGLFFE